MMNKLKMSLIFLIGFFVNSLMGMARDNYIYIVNLSKKEVRTRLLYDKATSDERPDRDLGPSKIAKVKIDKSKGSFSFSYLNKEDVPGGASKAFSWFKSFVVDDAQGEQYRGNEFESVKLEGEDVKNQDVLIFIINASSGVGKERSLKKLFDAEGFHVGQAITEKEFLDKVGRNIDSKDLMMTSGRKAEVKKCIMLFSDFPAQFGPEYDFIDIINKAIAASYYSTEAIPNFIKAFNEKILVIMKEMENVEKQDEMEKLKKLKSNVTDPTIEKLPLVSEVEVKKEQVKTKLVSDFTFEGLVKGGKITKKEFDKVRLEFLSTYKGYESDKFRALKKIVPAKSEVAIHADFHGDKYAMFAYLNDLALKGYLEKDNKFKIKQDKKDFYMVFLGDFTDRGPDGLEVLYCAMRLRAENPDRVEIIRGNHENTDQNDAYGLFKELNSKFEGELSEKRNEEITALLNPIYDVLPSVIYLGVENSNKLVDYIMLAHAGIEFRFNPNALLGGNNISEKIDKLDVNWIKDAEIKRILKNDAKLPDTFSYGEAFFAPGFLWNDFIVDARSKSSPSERGSANFMQIGKELADGYFRLCSNNKYSINAIIRGHQHSGDLFKLMIKHKGIYGLWLEDSKQWDGSKVLDIPKNSVWTLMVSPILINDRGLSYGKIYDYDFDTYAILKFGNEFKDWKLQPIFTKPGPEMKK